MATMKTTPPLEPTRRFVASPQTCLVAGRDLTETEWHEILPDRAYRRICT
jgi:hypothetical protein